ncbi:MAG: hypothetical protein JWR01_2355 [Subtercola sp.]|nr:hypothetical protein [Subtercola sp.]
MTATWTTADPWSPLPGSLAVVTGAAGGIGRAIVELLLDVGASVLASDVDAAALVRLADDLGSDSLFTFAADVSDSGQIRDLEAAARETRIPLGLWVNNAGIGLRRAAEQITAEEWDRVFGVNLRSVLLGAQAARRCFVDQGTGGSIINLSSVTGLTALPGRSAYGTSKAAVAHLTRQLAEEWGPERIRVNAIAPGFILTPLSHLWNAPENERGEEAGRIPLRRLGIVDDVARAALVLGSRLSDYQTGQLIVVDGGLTLS